MTRALLAIVLALAAAEATAEPRPVPTVQSERLWLGSAWYPEQWPEEAWERDIVLMKRQGANVVRIGEFAWARMEPEEGRIDLAGQRGWCTDQYLVVADRDVDTGQWSANGTQLRLAPLTRVGGRPAHHLAAEFGLAVRVEHEDAEPVPEPASLNR